MSQPKTDSSGQPSGHVLLESQIQSINRFPDQNPNPVMRISDDGRLTYANIASEPVRRSLGMEVGDSAAAELIEQLRTAAEKPGEVVEVVDGVRTFALLPVPVPDLGFMNVYGTDITAEKVVAKFPAQNPHPVLRITRHGEVIYFNDASRYIVDGLGLVIGQPLPQSLKAKILSRLAHEASGPIEIEVSGLVYELLPVLIPEFDFVNLYGTDVTAAREVARAKEETERLLLNILPPPIADRLRRGEPVIADRFEDCTLLIADIVGFTEISSAMSADDLVLMLDEVFRALDVLVERHGLEKVKTIGDAYMVIGGVPVVSDDHVERVADMALDMASEIEGLQQRLALPVRFRIGINCGPVIAGVIGAKRTIYDVWGDTVNMASRMESLGVPGRIQVTSAVYERLAGRYEFEERGMLEVKGKGMLPTYFLIARSG